MFSYGIHALLDASLKERLALSEDLVMCWGP